MPVILFVMKYPLHRRENLKAKFDGQMAAARALGWDTYCIGYDGHGMRLVGENASEPLCACPLSRVPGYEHTVIFIDLMRAVRKALQKKKIDALYLRYMPTFVNAVGAMRALKAQGGRLVMEYPTWPIAQENNRFFLRRQVFRYADRVLAKIDPMVDLFTLIGDKTEGTLRGRPAMNIVNGVNVEAFALHQPNREDPTVHLLALASMSGWHGYDRIIRSLAQYKGDADVRLHMVGGDGDGSLEKWRALSVELGLESKVLFEGPLYGDALDRRIAQCDVGVGSLGMYRYGLQSATTLKLREYMARGLPFLSAVEDPTLPDEPDFALKVPNDDTPISMEEVVAFARQAKQSSDTPARMRAWAMERMSWKGVLAPVLEKVRP